GVLEVDATDNLAVARAEVVRFNWTLLHVVILGCARCRARRSAPVDQSSSEESAAITSGEISTLSTGWAAALASSFWRTSSIRDFGSGACSCSLAPLAARSSSQ